MNPHIERAHLLLAQGRYDLAQREIGQALAKDPDNAYVHALLGACLHAAGKHVEAVEAAQRAIGLEPGMPYAHYVLALAWAGRHKWPEAERAARTAIDLDPADPDYYQILADIRFNREDWKGALDFANQGLAIDARHAGCLNSRAFALTKLGRADEAARTVEGVLADNPEDAYSHATRGWAALHQSDPDKALEHFREALRLDPDLDMAREGMVLALKSRYLVYRVMLQFFLWMGRQGRKFQWAIVIGIFISQQIAANVARSSPELAPFAWPVFFILLGFGLLTWLADPLFNLLLRFNRYGKHAVSPDARRCALLVGGSLATALGIFIYGLIIDSRVAELAAFGFVLLAVAFCAVYRFAAGWPRMAAMAYTLIMLGVNASALWHFNEGIKAAEEADRTVRLVRVEEAPKEKLPMKQSPVLRLEHDPELKARMHYHLDKFRGRIQVFAYGMIALMIISQVKPGTASRS